MYNNCYAHVIVNVANILVIISIASILVEMYVTDNKLS